MTSIEFTRTALEELDEAAAWYRKRNAALEQRFLTAARETADRIEANPLANQVVLDPDIRRANFPRRWPWSLFYYVRPDKSVVIGALHQRQSQSHTRLRGRSPG